MRKVRVVPNEQRHNCANCANCATVSKSDSASVVITVKDCRCTNLYSLCLLLFLKKSVKVFFKSSKSLPLGSEVGWGEILSRKRQHLGRKDGSDEDSVQVTPGIPVIMAIINLVTTRWQFASFGWLEAPIFAVIMQLRVLPVFFMCQCNAQLQFNWTLGPASPGKTFKRKIHRLKYSYDTESHNKPWELSARGCCNHGKIKNSAAKVQSVIAGCSVEQCSVEQCVIAASLEGRKPFAGQIYGRGMAGGRKINCNTANFQGGYNLASNPAHEPQIMACLASR